ncbi:L-ascorbate oxidase homolog [Olea europaea subsp. europaea]|uniref:L-ascorbate oxidase homolog n=1 Tax=Olea europaea subsp. europaea TaxID=158383 RepID=A0A8S0UUF9_OLEEU|nr:L-ascorbate oxidase homolog [Olea europaea subsp. europaea]
MEFKKPTALIPIIPGENWTYSFQMKDQIASYFYFPSLLFQKAAGGYGAIHVNNRIVIPISFPRPDYEYDILIGCILPLPDGILINGLGKNRATLDFEAGVTYRLKNLKYGARNQTDGISYYMLASSRFIPLELVGIGIIRYSGFLGEPLDPVPPFLPLYYFKYSIEQVRSMRCMVNGGSFVHPDTPLKLADYFQLPSRLLILNTTITSTGFPKIFPFLKTMAFRWLQLFHLFGMDFGTWNEEDEHIQHGGCNLSLHSSGISIVLDRDTDRVGRSRNVESKITGCRKMVAWARAAYKSEGGGARSIQNFSQG